MREREKPSLLVTLIRTVADRAVGIAIRYADRVVRRLLRLVGLFIAGLVIVLLGVGFLAIGVVKWLATMVPVWLAWSIVSIILLLIGVVLTLTAFLASRS